MSTNAKADDEDAWGTTYLGDDLSRFGGKTPASATMNAQPDVAPSPTIKEPNFGEPKFQLELDPESKITFCSHALADKGEKKALVEVKLTNITDDRQAFKVRCTFNKIFRINPSMGFCDVDETVFIALSFKSTTLPDNARHYFSFYHMKCTEKGRSASEVWNKDSKPDGVRRLRVFFKIPDGNGPPSPIIKRSLVELHPPKSGAHPKAKVRSKRPAPNLVKSDIVLGPLKPETTAETSKPKAKSGGASKPKQILEACKPAEVRKSVGAVSDGSDLRKSEAMIDKQSLDIAKGLTDAEETDCEMKPEELPEELPPIEKAEETVPEKPKETILPDNAAQQSKPTEPDSTVPEPKDSTTPAEPKPEAEPSSPKLESESPSTQEADSPSGPTDAGIPARPAAQPAVKPSVLPSQDAAQPFRPPSARAATPFRFPPLPSKSPSFRFRFPHSPRPTPSFRFPPLPRSFRASAFSSPAPTPSPRFVFPPLAPRMRTSTMQTPPVAPGPLNLNRLPSNGTPMNK